MNSSFMHPVLAVLTCNSEPKPVLARILPECHLRIVHSSCAMRDAQSRSLDMRHLSILSAQIQTVHGYAVHCSRTRCTA